MGHMVAPCHDALLVIQQLINDGIHHEDAHQIGVADFGQLHEQVAMALGGQRTEI